MADLHLKGASYYGVFYDPTRRPTRKWVPLGKNKLAAKLRLARLEQDHALGAFDPWRARVRDERPLLRAEIDRFLAADAGRRPKTLQAYRDVLSRFERSVAPATALADVRSEDVRAFLARPGLADASRASYHRHLRAFFRWAVASGALRASPLDDVSAPRSGRADAAFLSVDGARRLVETMRAGGATWLADLTRFALATGLRLGEVVALRWGAVDLDHRRVRVLNADGFRTKSGHDRSVPLAGDALDVLTALRGDRTPDPAAPVFAGVRGGALHAPFVSRRFRDFRRRAGLPEGVHFHSLRHTCASWLVMRGVPLVVVQAVLGHSSVAVTQRYAHLAPETLRAAMYAAFGADDARLGESTAPYAAAPLATAEYHGEL